MKILHLLQSSVYSGAENVVCQIINLFKDDDDIEMVYCSRDGQIRDVLSKMGVTFYPLADFSKKEIKKAFSEIKPDIVHAHDMRASYLAAKTCGKIPLISHVHNNNFDSRSVSLKSIAFLYAAKKAKHIFWVSKSSYEGYAFHRYFKGKSTILYNIIDIELLKNKAHEDHNQYNYDVVYLGRFSPPKNPHRLLDVCNLAVKKKKDIKIAAIGTGEMFEEIKNRSHSLGLDNNVFFLGYMANPLKVLEDSKVMIMTSLWEGTPMCALEAQALGVPVVSTPVDGLKDIIVNSSNGYLLDDNDLLADSIIKILNNENGIHDEMSKNQIKASIKHNDTKIYFEKLKNAYKNAYLKKVK